MADRKVSQFGDLTAAQANGEMIVPIANPAASGAAGNRKMSLRQLRDWSGGSAAGAEAVAEAKAEADRAEGAADRVDLGALDEAVEQSGANAGAAAGSASAAAGSAAQVQAALDTATDLIITTFGNFDTVAELVAAHPTAATGNTAFVRATGAAGTVHRWSGSAWVDTGESPLAGKADVDAFDAEVRDRRAAVEITSADGYLAVIQDRRGREAFGLRPVDGGPMDHTRNVWLKRIEEVRALFLQGDLEGYSLALTALDLQGRERFTDLALDLNGRWPEWWIQRQAARMAPYIVADAAHSVKHHNSSPARLAWSIARGRIRYDANETPPSGVVTTTINGFNNWIWLPADHADNKPRVAVIYCHGVGGTGELPGGLGPALAAQGVIAMGGGLQGTSYGNPASMADLKATYEWLTAFAPISGVVIFGASMGALTAQNALAMGAVPGILGLYLVDPVYSMRQRYDNGRAGEIQTAYGIASDGSDYAAKTAGYDPALRLWTDWSGVPVHIRGSITDDLVPFAAHGMQLAEKLSGHNDVTLQNLGSGGHSAPNRYSIADLMAFIAKVSGGPVSYA